MTPPPTAPAATSTEVLFEMRGGLLIVTFNRPDKGNAFNGGMAKAFYEKIKSVSEDRGVRAILLRGNGDDFMIGHDLSAYYVGDTHTMQDLIFQKVHMFYAAIREMQIMEKPIIAAVHGRVGGAGLNFAAASDLVIASRGTVFNGGFTSAAMVPDGGTTFFLARKVGACRANEILMLNEDFGPETAEQWGLINRIAEMNAFQDEALAWAEKLARGATRAIGATKRLIGKAFEQDMNAHLSQETAIWTLGSKTFDFREAMKAAQAGRTPTFTGA